MRTAFTFVLWVALASAAGADDRATLVELRLFGKPTKVAGPGNFVEVVGRGLHRCPPAAAPAPGAPAPRPCAHAGLVVRVGGDPMPVVAAGPESILFNLDGVRPGRRQVVVELDGRRVGTLELEVLAQAVAAPGGGDDGGDEERKVLQAGFAVTRFDVVRDADGGPQEVPSEAPRRAGNERSVPEDAARRGSERGSSPADHTDGVRFVVEGKAQPLPDGLRMTVALAYGRRAVDVQLVPVVSGVYRATFGPLPRALPLGGWTASARFEVGKQQRKLLREWRPAEALLDAIDHLERSLSVEVGTPEEVAAQREALRAHYRAVSGETERLLDEVLAAYASACRVLFRDDGRGTYRQGEHLRHVEQVGAARTPAERERVQGDLRFATSSGHLKADEYQGWAEGTLLPAWLGSYRADRAFRDATWVPIDPRAALQAELLHTVVFGTVREHARALFGAAKLPPPSPLLTPPGGVELVALDSAGTGRRPFERARDELARLVGP